MELLATILYSLLISTLVGVLPAVFRTVAVLLAKVLVVSEQSQVSMMDRILAETGWCTARSLGPARLPSDGAHFAYLRGPVVAVRSSEARGRGGDAHSYRVYVFGRAAAEALRDRLTGDPRDVVLRYVYAPAPWRITTVTLRSAPPTPARAWQARVVGALLEQYRARGRATALVCGSMGTGKSSLGELLAAAIQLELKRSPEVVKNLNLATKGLILEDAFDRPTPNSPVILMLDEFDSAVDHAERASLKDGDKREGSSLAETPTDLLTALDRINLTEHLVVIATTNRTLEEMTDVRAIYARYTRPGRLDLHCTAEAAPPCPKKRE